MYGIVVKGRKHGRDLMVIWGKLYEDVRSMFENPERLRELVHRHFGVLVKAFTYCSPRGLSGRQIPGMLRESPGIRPVKRLIYAVGSRSGTCYTRKWLRELFREDMRDYGFHKAVYGCIRSFMEERCRSMNLWSACRLLVLGMVLLPKSSYIGGN